jgi:cytochrome aa3-600 menaquinol oxidase subunit IV
MLDKAQSTHPQSLPSHEENFPWKHIVGYVLSLLLTGATLWFGFGHVLGGGVLQTAMMLLGIVQILVQLLFFMHISEGGTTSHVWMILLGFFFTFVVIAASIWIMTFNSQVQ